MHESAGKVAGKDGSGESVDGERFDYVIAFKKPVEIGSVVTTLDATVATRDVLFSEVRRSDVSSLDLVRLFTKRSGKVVPLAGARARSEYASPENLGTALRPRARCRHGATRDKKHRTEVRRHRERK